MALENRETLLAVAKAFEKLAMDQLRDNGEGEILQYAMRFESTSPEIVLNRLFSFATMKKWVGERKISDTLIQDFSISSEKYESTILVNRDDLVWDRLGMYELDIANMVDSYRRKRRRHALQILQDNPKGQDGVPLFATNHKLYDEAGSTYSNDLGATKPLNSTNFDAAVEQMMLQKDHQGEPLDITPNTLIVGPKLAKTVRDLFGLRFISDGATTIENPQYNNGPANVVVEPLIGSSEEWYLLDAAKPLKPLILMDVPRPSGQLVEFAAVTNPDDSFVFDNDAYKYGISARWGLAAGVWQVILRANK